MTTSIWDCRYVMDQLHASFPYFTYLINGDSLDIFYNTYKVTSLSVRKNLTLFSCGYSLCWDGHEWNNVCSVEDAVNGTLDLVTDSPIFSPYHLIQELKREIADMKKIIMTVPITPSNEVVYEEENHYETPVGSPNNNIEWEEIDGEDS
nr:hypothetical protein K-LCC10_0196 [Kaumoebavirus]